jgi:hypothetical protein
MTFEETSKVHGGSNSGQDIRTEYNLDHDIVGQTWEAMLLWTVASRTEKKSLNIVTVATVVVIHA